MEIYKIMSYYFLVIRSISWYNLVLNDFTRYFLIFQGISWYFMFLAKFFLVFQLFPVWHFMYLSKKSKIIQNPVNKKAKSNKSRVNTLKYILVFHVFGLVFPDISYYFLKFFGISWYFLMKMYLFPSVLPLGRNFTWNLWTGIHLSWVGLFEFFNRKHCEFFSLLWPMLWPMLRSMLWSMLWPPSLIWFCWF
jgi:hypothetical protein